MSRPSESPEALLDHWIDDRRENGFALIETHISRVLVGAEDVYKLKKPVDFGFLDFTTLEKRRRACEAEITLNRRLAPDVYLGTLALIDDGSARLVPGNGQENVLEWVVHMRRMPDHTRADVMLREGRLGRTEIGALGRTLAEFHDRCREDENTREFGSYETIRANVEENFAQTRDVLGELVDQAVAAEIEAWQKSFLDSRRELFATRVREGKIRDGHGDLRLEHVYFDQDTAAADSGERHVGDKIEILDCIEFNDRFRYADVCCDVAFLAMDIASSGSVELAEHLLAEYARHSNDFSLYPLVDFYESYRAFIRGKIDALTLQSETLSRPAAERLGRRARHHFLLAQASDRRQIQPARIVAVGGWIASGKSTIAEQLSAELQCPVVAADWTRKYLLGLELTEKASHPAFAGGYSQDVTQRVYDEIMQRARLVVDSGRSVVVDASFRSRQERSHVRKLALDLGVEFRFVECRADVDTCRKRLEKRALGASESDGRLEIFDAFVEAWEPVDELPPHQHLTIDTSRSLVESTSRLRETFRTWLPAPASRG